MVVDAEDTDTDPVDLDSVLCDLSVTPLYYCIFGIIFLLT